VIKFHALIDCGTTSYAFIDEDYACYYHLLLHFLKLPKNLTVNDGRLLTLGTTSHIVQTCLTIHNNQEDISLFVIKLEHYSIVLETPWLQPHDVCLYFVQNKVIFDFNYYFSYQLDDAFDIQGTIQDPFPIYLNSIARPLGHIALNTQET
jgi:hypothetical protein